QLVFYRTVTPAKKDDSTLKSETTLCHWKRGSSAAVPVRQAVAAASLGARMQAPPLSPAASALTQPSPPPAGELTPKDKPDFLPGHVVSDQAPLSFSQDGKSVSFGVVAPPPKAAVKDNPSVELWHYKDDFIQPMQKARYVATPKTYRAVFHLA